MTGRSVALEIAVQDAAGARDAFAAGADRLELCQALGATGGITPSAATLDAVLGAGAPGRVAVLVRPRPGGFVYDQDEAAVVESDIRDVVRRGAGGVVIGALTHAGRVDRDVVRRWRDAAGDVEFVFHRAIDTLPEPEAVLDDLVDLGVTRILTSGGAARSIDGVPVIERLVAAGAGRLQIMAGGGVRVEDIPALAATGVDAVHLSAKRLSDAPAPSGPGGGPDRHEITDRTIVAAARSAIS
ncbi:copper homeostasis protein CutC [Microbacterium abyssi]|uniref:copper homeostasis protein CutC n=1 Tax=Microbacterium abyssi TaxID=2782166 RepID=UPI00188852F7|nr:copper homeostasis protein CutC [Microbacterium sp. A18JL241]